jgi:hypothetical protein
MFTQGVATIYRWITFEAGGSARWALPIHIYCCVYILIRALYAHSAACVLMFWKDHAINSFDMMNKFLIYIL